MILTLIWSCHQNWNLKDKHIIGFTNRIFFHETSSKSHQPYNSYNLQIISKFKWNLFHSNQTNLKKNLFFLAGEMPNAPAHVLQSWTPLPGVPGGNHLDPSPIQIGFINTCDHLFHKVLGGVEMPPISQSHRCRLWLLNGRCPSWKYSLQVPINPFIPRHHRFPAVFLTKMIRNQEIKNRGLLIFPTILDCINRIISWRRFA